MTKNSWIAAVIALGLMASAASAQDATPPPATPAPKPAAVDNSQEIKDITAKLADGTDKSREDALDQIHQLQTGSPADFANNFPMWIPPLLKAKEWDEVDQLSLAAIFQRAFDPKVCLPAQQARVMVLIGQAKYDDALIEAHSYFNVAPMANTAEAIDLVSQVLAKDKSQAEADKFKADQIAADANGSDTIPVPNSIDDLDKPPSTDPSTEPSNPNALLAIDIDPSEFESGLTALQGRKGKNGYSPTNLIGQGNLQLLSGHPSEAMHAFLDAYKAGTSAKYRREAFEGMAQAIRDQDGNVARANAFILTVRDNPDAFAAKLFGGVTAADLGTASVQTAIADLQPPTGNGMAPAK
ncbi:MAG: hypothetical protein ABSG31_00490 [Tepidisphaeraceae bacterium]|jgi:hypothetical protein